MTKAELIYILQRYRYIVKAVHSKKTHISFYVGNRKEMIALDNQVEIIFSIIDDIMNNESKLIVKIMKYWLKRGYSDERIILNVPLSRSSYYRIKRTIENKIYQCCIKRGLVSYKELLNEKIG